MIEQLSIAQSNIVRAPLGNALQVLASAGSGKTRVLTERVRFIIQSAPRGGVIALTFTNKAADEMMERLDEGLFIKERTWIATIHSVAQRILESYGYTIGLPKELHIYERDQDRMEVFIHSLREQGINIDEYLNIDDEREKRNREKIMSQYLTAFSYIKRELLTEEDVNNLYSNTPRMWSVFQDYQSALLESGGVDFDDILLYAHKILLNQEPVSRIYQKKYIAVFVDEAQDLNRAQYEFIKVLCGNKIKDVMMVGDSNQMIYGFNGSSSDFFIKKFKEDFSPIVYHLIENYRSSKAIIQLANKIKPNSQVGVIAALDGIKKLIALPDEEAEATWVCNKIEKIINSESLSEIEGAVDYSNFVVIGRNRFVFKAIEKEMKIRKIPFYLKRSDRNEMPASLIGRVIDLAMRVKINPKDWVDAKKLFNLIDLLNQSEAKDLFLIDEILGKVKISQVKNKDVILLALNAISNLDLDYPNLIKFCSDLKSELNSLGVNEKDSSKAEEIALGIKDIEQLNSMWLQFKRKGLGDSLLSFKNALSLGQLSGDGINKGVMLSTVHTMKGLEKDIVFLVGMCEGVFPDYRAKTKAEIEEERNSAFVAVTRSRRWIFISYPEKRMMPWGDFKYHAASRFFEEMK
ncbi:ATP-dependent helicase [Pantoea sp. BIGb0393]|uniref:DNA 3'-5' helicase n=1 Tax=Pantoea nemavictus TaxID=2726955 RepID=A0ABU8PQU1_9GAMM|nr:ATP-dependent helicase [Pantoea nemavictus]MBA0035486.1 ATP-dependent helicase [Pantoea nemavictus]